MTNISGGNFFTVATQGADKLFTFGTCPLLTILLCGRNFGDVRECRSVL